MAAACVLCVVASANSEQSWSARRDVAMQGSSGCSWRDSFALMLICIFLFSYGHPEGVFLNAFSFSAFSRTAFRKHHLTYSKINVNKVMKPFTNFIFVPSEKK